MTDVLIERASFLASLGDLLGEALDGYGRLVFLGGEAGVGKTALATAFASTATGVGVRRGLLAAGWPSRAASWAARSRPVNCCRTG
jgi:tRNA A37 threonylcarbamoyladenosine biosynthesis protein TsaE